MHRVFISQVGCDAQSGNAVVILEEPESDRLIPIWIGAPEAAAIGFAMQNIKTDRPLTHQLLFDTLEELDYAVEKVEITEIRNKAFFANLFLAKKPGKGVAKGELDYKIIDSRPSDALALAVLSSAPVFMSSSVLEQAGLPRKDVRTIGGPEDDEVQPSKRSKKGKSKPTLTPEEIAKEDESFRDFVQNIKASDFNQHS